MSATAQLDLLPEFDLPGRSVPGRRLQPVTATPRRRPRLAYGIIAVAGALAIAAAQMGLSIAMTQGVYEEQALVQERRDLTWQQQTLTDELTGLSSPQYLAANAAALGMVINASPSYLRLSDGAILGSGAAASADSTVDAINRSSVPNSLVADSPLVTEPDATMQGLPQEPVVVDPNAAEAALPPALSEGLPSPVTR